MIVLNLSPRGFVTVRSKTPSPAGAGRLSQSPQMKGRYDVQRRPEAPAGPASARQQVKKNAPRDIGKGVSPRNIFVTTESFLSSYFHRLTGLLFPTSRQRKRHQPQNGSPRV